jgi:hypothetical protein
MEIILRAEVAARERSDYVQNALEFYNHSDIRLPIYKQEPNTKQTYIRAT